ncbi:MAG TPA: hypothetical protein VKB55_02710 [Nocardioidaceae bacterium]|jgi:hypothetical protein|nr:hypothetical protein [Nocardioidaceae bacterium]
MRGTSYTDVERIARQQIDERVACRHLSQPTNERRMSRRNRVRSGTAETLRRLANALDVSH